MIQKLYKWYKKKKLSNIRSKAIQKRWLDKELDTQEIGLRENPNSYDKTSEVLKNLLEEIKNVKNKQVDLDNKLDEVLEEPQQDNIDNPIPQIQPIQQIAPLQEPIKDSTDFNKLINQFEQINDFRNKLKDEIMEELDAGDGASEKNKSKLIELIAPKLLDMVGTGKGAIPQKETQNNAFGVPMPEAIQGTPKSDIIG